MKIEAIDIYESFVKIFTIMKYKKNNLLETFLFKNIDFLIRCKCWIWHDTHANVKEIRLI